MNQQSLWLGHLCSGQIWAMKDHSKFLITQSTLRKNCLRDSLQPSSVHRLDLLYTLFIVWGPREGLWRVNTPVAYFLSTCTCQKFQDYSLGPLREMHVLNMYPKGTNVLLRPTFFSSFLVAEPWFYQRQQVTYLKGISHPLLKVNVPCDQILAKDIQIEVHGTSGSLLFMYLFRLCWVFPASSSCREWGLFSSWGAWASLVAEHRPP